MYHLENIIFIKIWYSKYMTLISHFPIQQEELKIILKRFQKLIN